MSRCNITRHPPTNASLSFLRYRTLRIVRHVDQRMPEGNGQSSTRRFYQVTARVKIQVYSAPAPTCISNSVRGVQAG